MNFFNTDIGFGIEMVNLSVGNACQVMAIVESYLSNPVIFPTHVHFNLGSHAANVWNGHNSEQDHERALYGMPERQEPVRYYRIIYGTQSQPVTTHHSPVLG